MSSPDQCASCGSGLAAGARFCRRCGAAVDKTAAGSDGSATPTAPSERTAAAPPDAPAVPPAAPASPVPPAPRRGRGALLAGAAIVACLVLGGLVGGGAYLLVRDAGGAEEGTITDPPIGGSGSRTGDGSGDDGLADGRRSDLGDVPVSTTFSDLIPGRFVQAGTFRSPEGAQQEVDRLQGESLDVFTIPSDWADELLPGFRVLLVGPLSGAGEERRVLRGLERAGVTGLGKDLTPSAELSGPETAAGTWGGSVEQSSLRGARSPTTYRVEFAIAPDGEGGTIEYPRRGCSGSLTLIDDAGYSLSYRETIEAGDCPPGGVWHLRPQGAEITAVRLHGNLEFQVMVKGTVPALPVD